MAEQTFKFDVRHDTKRIVAEIRAEGVNVTKATARAINRTAEMLRTEAGKIIRAEYKVTLRGIRQASKIRKASTRSRFPRAEVSFSGRRINLLEFGARAVNPWNVKGRLHRRRGGGVSVHIKVASGRQLIRGAFLTTLKSGQNKGKYGVFARKGAARDSIQFKHGLSIPQMTETRAINKALLKFADTRYLTNLRHQLEFLLSGGR